MLNLVELHPTIKVSDALRALADDIEKTGETPSFCTVIMHDDIYQIGESKLEVANMRSIVEMQLAINYLLEQYNAANA